MTLHTALTLVHTQGTVPVPTPEQPPGTDGFLTVLNWVSWIVIICGVVGFLISAGTLAFASFTGREVNSFKGLVLAILCCVLAGAVGGIMQVFV